MLRRWEVVLARCEVRCERWVWREVCRAVWRARSSGLGGRGGAGAGVGAPAVVGFVAVAAVVFEVVCVRSAEDVNGELLSESVSGADNASSDESRSGGGTEIGRAHV